MLTTPSPLEKCAPIFFKLVQFIIDKHKLTIHYVRHTQPVNNSSFTLKTSHQGAILAKISKKERQKKRKAILRSAVDLISEKGYKASTMRAIAKKAQVGEATIYNYFSTKEDILFDYYHDHMETCITTLQQIEEFHTFNLQEQVQAFFNSSLDLYLLDREFVEQTFSKVFLASSKAWSGGKPIRNRFISIVEDMLAAAVEVEEIPPPAFQGLIAQFFLDSYIGMVHYWLHDTSKNFSNTSLLTDRGLDLAYALLKAGITNKLFDLTAFLFKTHIINKLDHFVDPLKELGKVKRRFMETMDER